jgi:hypothetical protein
VTAAAVVVLVAGWQPATATAQAVGLTRIQGDLGFGLNYENEQLSQPSGDQHLDRLYFEERVGLRGDGFVYDPALARFTLGGQLGLFQDRVHSDTSGVSTDRSGHGLLTGYDLRLGLLGEKPYGLDVFARRSENNTRRDFAGNVKTNIDEYGAFWRLQNIPFPSYLSFEQVQVKQRFTLLPTGVQQDETRRIVTYDGQRRWDTHTLTANYRFDDVSDRVRPNGDYQIHNGSVYDVWRFTDDPADYASSSVRVLQREGSIAGTTLLGHEGVHLRHSSSLATDYTYNVAYLDSPGTGSQVNQVGFAGLQYQLYRSLTSALNGNASYTELSPGHDLTYGAGGVLNYRKAVPWGGTFLAGAGLSYQIDDRDVPAGAIAAVDETHTFDAFDEITLDNPDVILSSIVVTDQGHFGFALDLDYTIEQRGRRTVLHRALFGGIAAGQTVLVSYDFQSGGRLKTAGYPINFNAGLDFEWLYLFYAGDRFRESVLEGNPTETLGAIDSDTAGVQLRWSHAPGQIVLLNEYTMYDARDLRYSAWTFTQTGSAAPRRNVVLGLSAIESFYDYTEPNRSRTFYSQRATARWRPFYSLFLDGFVGFRYQRETSIPRDKLLEFGMRGRWTFGLFTVSLSYDHAAQDIGRSSRVGDLVRFDVLRHF